MAGAKKKAPSAAAQKKAAAAWQKKVAQNKAGISPVTGHTRSKLGTAGHRAEIGASRKAASGHGRQARDARGRFA